MHCKIAINVNHGFFLDKNHLFKSMAKKMVLCCHLQITTKLSKILPVFMSLAAETLVGLWRGDLPSPDTGSPSRPEMAESGTGEMRCPLGMVLWMGNMKYL